MKKLIFLPIYLFFISITAQSEFEKEYFEKSYRDTFKNESIVIARKMEEYTYSTYGINDYKITAVVRIQYLLKDIYALSAFSTMSKNQDLKRFEIKQVKPSGKVNSIFEYYDKNYPDDGYEEELGKEQKNKKNKEEIPLEDLEIGDIIDYKYEFTFTSKTKDFRKVLLENGKYDNVTREVYNYDRYKFLMFKNKFIEDNYPIASSVIFIQTPSDLQLIQKSLNCAYRFETKSGSGKTTHICHINQVKPFKSYDFSYSYLHHPTIKYALIQTNQAKAAAYPYQFSSDQVSADEIALLGKKMYADKNFIPKYLFYLNTRKESEPYKEVSLDKFFSVFLKTFCKNDKSKPEKLNKLHEYLTNKDDLNNKYLGSINYAVILARFCDKIGLKYQMMAAIHKYDGKWNEIISPYEITWGLYIPDSKRDLYISNYSEESNIYQRFGSMSGMDILVFDPKAKEFSVQKLSYPEVPSSENTYLQNSEIVISDDNEFDYTFVNTYQMTGSFTRSINSQIRGQFNNKKLRTPYRFFGLVDYMDIYNLKQFNSIDELIEELGRVDSSYRLYFDDYYKEQMYYYVHDEYKIFNDLVIDSSRVYEDGDFNDDEFSPYGFKVVFKAKGLLLSGSNETYKILRLGSLMTSQYQISNFQVEERSGNVYNSNLREIRWKNSIEIPEGYTCVNLEDFNLKFENEAGLFNATAVVEDGKIIFQVEKIYKTHFLPQNQWMDMVNFLQTAEKMFLRNLILQKI